MLHTFFIPKGGAINTDLLRTVPLGILSVGIEFEEPTDCIGVFPISAIPDNTADWYFSLGPSDSTFATIGGGFALSFNDGDGNASVFDTKGKYYRLDVQCTTGSIEHIQMTIFGGAL